MRIKYIRLRIILSALILALSVLLLHEVRMERPNFTVAQMTNTNDKDPNDFYWSSLQSEAWKNTQIVLLSATALTILWIKPAGKFAKENGLSFQGQ